MGGSAYSRSPALAAVLAVMMAAGCSTNSVTGPTLMNIVIIGDDRLPGVGRTLQLTVIATFSDGAQQDQTGATSWSSANPGVATVSGLGLVTATAEGATDIRASYGGASLAKAIRVEIPKPANPALTSSVSVTTSPEPAYQWRAHLQITYVERSGSTGFRVDSAQIDYRDGNNQSRFNRTLGPDDFQQAWGTNRVAPGQTAVIGRQLDFAGVDSTTTVNITTSVTDDLGNTVSMATTATGKSALARSLSTPGVDLAVVEKEDK